MILLGLGLLASPALADTDVEPCSDVRIGMAPLPGPGVPTSSMMALQAVDVLDGRPCTGELEGIEVSLTSADGVEVPLYPDAVGDLATYTHEGLDPDTDYDLVWSWSRAPEPLEVRFRTGETAQGPPPDAPAVSLTSATWYQGVVRATVMTSGARRWWTLSLRLPNGSITQRLPSLGDATLLGRYVGEGEELCVEATWVGLDGTVGEASRVCTLPRVVEVDEEDVADGREEGSGCSSLTVVPALSAVLALPLLVLLRRRQRP